jgi:hypothetical protein
MEDVAFHMALRLQRNPVARPFKMTPHNYILGRNTAPYLRLVAE